MIDKEKIEKLFSELENYLTTLNNIANLSDAQYLDDSKNIYSGRYLLQVSIKTCINIANHIVSRMKYGIPKEYAESFRLLNQFKIISDNL